MRLRPWLLFVFLSWILSAVYAENYPSDDNLQNEILRSIQQLKSKIKPRPLEDHDIVGRSRLEQAVKHATKFTIVIDAGHGGKDPGAIGLHGSKEKNIVLGIAQQLAQQINTTSNMRAKLTRNGDYFVPLRQRLKLAREESADLFIAIHADAYIHDTALGASVYALSQRGASSEAARWLAQRDNYSELGNVALDALYDHDPMLRSVLVDLAQTATIQDSIRLGNKVLDNLETVSSLHDKEVERAPFVVLKSPDIPSILVETGFISNPLEERRLVTSIYQWRVAQALFHGVQDYVQKYRDSR